MTEERDSAGMPIVPDDPLWTKEDREHYKAWKRALLVEHEKKINSIWWVKMTPSVVIPMPLHVGLCLVALPFLPYGWVRDYLDKRSYKKTV